MVIWAYGIWDMVIWAYGKRNCTLTRRSGEVGGFVARARARGHGKPDSGPRKTRFGEGVINKIHYMMYTCFLYI
jgi:hypothetical protein